MVLPPAPTNEPFPPLPAFSAPQPASAFAPPPLPSAADRVREAFAPPVPAYQPPPPPAYQPPVYEPPAPAYQQPEFEPTYDAPSAPISSLPPLSFVNPASAFPEPMPLSRSAPVILEVTPRGLGIATVAGFCEELIRRNSRLPTEIKKVFATSRDRQPSVRIVVCQGESKRLDNNTIIGDLVLQNLPPRPRGETEIEVTFMLDASGILQVSARDAKTGAEQRASLDLVGGVAQQDVAASRERIQQLRR